MTTRRILRSALSLVLAVLYTAVLANAQAQCSGGEVFWIETTCPCNGNTMPGAGCSGVDGRCGYLFPGYDCDPHYHCYIGLAGSCGSSPQAAKDRSHDVLAGLQVDTQAIRKQFLGSEANQTSTTAQSTMIATCERGAVSLSEFRHLALTQLRIARGDSAVPSDEHHAFRTQTQ